MMVGEVDQLQKEVSVCKVWGGAVNVTVPTGRGQEFESFGGRGTQKSCSKMEPRWFLLLVVVLGTLLAAGNAFEIKIIGGHEVAPHSCPYMASLQKAGSHLCGGVLVHPRWVLTAAHCLTEPVQRLRLVLGLHDLHNPHAPGLTFHIKAAIRHPGYNLHLENDLMLLKLDGQVRPSRTIRPLAVPRGRRAVPAGTKCSMVGWGQTHQGGKPARTLQKLDLHVLDIRMCNNSRFWNGSITSHMLCLAADSKAQAPCKGDSGGPLVCSKGQLSGILSFSSKTCTDVFKPPVATAVAPYVSWIRKITGRCSE
ncbi:granzyme M isoform X2 [Castor canadensis]|uniref:Granzyme M n=1 Tax=Castor canadensis TaxID=51338 RepID=A0A8C0XBP9_CASCN|nr:granzyme M isoform X2 [Castor canadensis]